jgi:hypothetical protein
MKKNQQKLRALDERTLATATGGGYVSSCLEVGGAGAVGGMYFGGWGALAAGLVGCGVGIGLEYLDRKAQES